MSNEWPISVLIRSITVFLHNFFIIVLLFVSCRLRQNGECSKLKFGFFMYFVNFEQKAYHFYFYRFLIGKNYVKFIKIYIFTYMNIFPKIYCSS